MITPCNAANGCGTLAPINGASGSAAASPAGELSPSQMTNVASAQPSAMPSPSLGPATLPSQSGIIASTFPMPGTTPPVAIDPPETIPGQPDPPFVQDSISGALGNGGSGTISGSQGSSAAGSEIGTGSSAGAWGSGLSTGAGGVVPQPVLPEAPQFTVPQNPLLPPGYQEFISYENLQYLNGFLRTQIGKYMRVEQLIGSNILEDRYGYLIGVGINYILLQEQGTGNVSALDYYNIKYVHIYYSTPGLPAGEKR